MSATATPPTTEPTVAARPWVLAKARAAIIPTAILILAVGIVLSSNRWTSWVAHGSTQTTDDAQLRADITPLSTKASGIVARVAVTDFQPVKAGDLLVQLKDDDFRLQVDLADAAVRAAHAALQNLKSQRDIQAARIAQAGANIRVTSVEVDHANVERLREEALDKDRVTTKQRVEQVVADHERLRATLAGRNAELEAQRRQLAAFDTQETQLRADLSAKEATLAIAKVNLDYTRVVAPTDGVVGERRVRPGQLVSAGTQIISLVGQTVWVVANFKETQLANVHVGSRTVVTIDGLPDLVWSGRVETISPASGSQFSLLPPDNATGNFTKVTQRIPVRIVLDSGQPQAERLRAGMSVVATIDAVTKE